MIECCGGRTCARRRETPLDFSPYNVKFMSSCEGLETRPDEAVYKDYVRWAEELCTAA